MGSSLHDTEAGRIIASQVMSNPESSPGSGNEGWSVVAHALGLDQTLASVSTTPVCTKDSKVDEQLVEPVADDVGPPHRPSRPEEHRGSELIVQFPAPTQQVSNIEAASCSPEIKIVFNIIERIDHHLREINATSIEETRAAMENLASFAIWDYGRTYSRHTEAGAYAEDEELRRAYLSLQALWCFEKLMMENGERLLGVKTRKRMERIGMVEGYVEMFQSFMNDTSKNGKEEFEKGPGIEPEEGDPGKGSEYQLHEKSVFNWEEGDDEGQSDAQRFDQYMRNTVKRVVGRVTRRRKESENAPPLIPALVVNSRHHSAMPLCRAAMSSTPLADQTVTTVRVGGLYLKPMKEPLVVNEALRSFLSTFQKRGTPLDETYTTNGIGWVKSDLELEADQAVQVFEDMVRHFDVSEAETVEDAVKAHERLKALSAFDFQVQLKFGYKLLSDEMKTRLQLQRRFGAKLLG